MGDFVMAPVRAKHRLKKSNKELYIQVMGPRDIICKLGSHAYVQDILENLGISPISDVRDVAIGRDTFESLCFPFGASASA